MKAEKRRQEFEVTKAKYMFSVLMFSDEDHLVRLMRQDKVTREAVNTLLCLCEIEVNYQTLPENLYKEQLKQFRKKRTIDGESKPVTVLWKEIIAARNFELRVLALGFVLQCKAVLDHFYPGYFDVTEAGASPDRNVPTFEAAVVATKDFPGETSSFLVYFASLASENPSPGPEEIQHTITDFTKRWDKEQHLRKMLSMATRGKMI